MGQQHNELRRGGLSDAFTRAVGDSRGDGGLERYSESLVAVLDLWSQPEWAFLRAERLCAHFVNVPAVAAEFGACALVNPAASGIIVVVERALFDSTTAGLPGQLEHGTEAVIAATLATATNGTVRDRRWGGTFTTAAVVRSGSDPAAAIGLPFELRRRAAGESFDFQFLPTVLNPGQGLIMIAQTVNVVFNGGFTWRERLALPGELV